MGQPRPDSRLLQVQPRGPANGRNRRDCAIPLRPPRVDNPPECLANPALSIAKPRQVALRGFIAVSRRELEKASGLPFVLCQPANAPLVEHAKVGLRIGITLIGG